METRQITRVLIFDILNNHNLVEEISGTFEEEASYSSISADSRQIGSGHVFIAIPGLKNDGHNFIPQAVKNGAALLIVEKTYKNISVPMIRVRNSRKAYALIAHAIAGFPARDLTLIGITGTNGKTTTTFLIQSILDKVSIPAAVIGTTGAYFQKHYYSLDHTTPDSLVLMEIIRKCKNDGAKVIIMEVSSHGIDQERIYGLIFSLGIFTNLSQDHLDYHENLDMYASVKWRFFEENCKNGSNVFNLEDPCGFKFHHKAESLKIGYGFSPEAEIRAENCIINSNTGTSFTLRYGQKKIGLKLPLAGRFNILNSLAASSIKEVFDISLKDIKAGLEAVKKVPGRLEEVPNNSGIRVFIDYAHTPEALRNVLETLREICQENRIILVFGCGGDRDKEKRPLMGQIGSELADFCILTNDNPRTEKPGDIMLGIVRGVQKVTYRDYEVIFDRHTAIHKALRKAKPGDIVLIAGKGHEEYQIIGSQKVHFSDKEEVHEYFTDIKEI